MNYIRDIYVRFAALIHETLKFCIVGMIGVVITIAVVDALHLGAHVGPLTSQVGGYAVATAVTFLGNRYWASSRRSGGSLGRETVLFCLCNVGGIFIQVAVVGLVTYVMDLKDPLSYNVATFIGISFGTIFRLWSYRQWVFSAPHPVAGTEEKEPQPVA